MSPSQAMTTTSLFDADSPKPDTEVSSVPVRIMSSYLTAFPCFGTAYHPPRLIGPERVAFPLQLARHLYSLLVLSIKCQNFPSPISPPIRPSPVRTYGSVWRRLYILFGRHIIYCLPTTCASVRYISAKECRTYMSRTYGTARKSEPETMCHDRHLRLLLHIPMPYLTYIHTTQRE